MQENNSHSREIFSSWDQENINAMYAGAKKLFARFDAKSHWETRHALVATLHWECYWLDIISISVLALNDF